MLYLCFIHYFEYDDSIISCLSYVVVAGFFKEKPAFLFIGNERLVMGNHITNYLLLITYKNKKSTIFAPVLKKEGFLFNIP